MRITFFSFIICSLLCALFSCTQEDMFDVTSNGTLSFSIDTLTLDTVFSTTSTPTKTLWAYNGNKKGIRCRSVRLERGNQTGFQVNVDGIYLGPNSGYQTNEILVNGKDSVRIYVKILAATTEQETPQLLTDNLIFSFDNGTEQRINLRAWAWDATLLRDIRITNDTIISSQKPIVVYGGLTIEEGKTLTINEGTTIYFHAGAGINVNGTLICRGTATNNVVLRGDRLDKLFDNLPYDRVSGQWQGVKINSSSYGNKIEYTDIHSTFNGIEIDSSDVSREKLLLNASSIYNCLGEGLLANYAQVRIVNSVIANAQNNCVLVKGGRTRINGSTLAQFYPFSAQRGAALRIDNSDEKVESFECENSLITGISSDEMFISLPQNNFTFPTLILRNNVIRTPMIDKLQNATIENVTYEMPNDTTGSGEHHFVNIDFTDMKFDFHLLNTSLAVGKANANTLPITDRDGNERQNKLDVGAYILKEQ